MLADHVNGIQVKNALRDVRNKERLNHNICERLSRFVFLQNILRPLCRFSKYNCLSMSIN